MVAESAQEVTTDSGTDKHRMAVVDGGGGGKKVIATEKSDDDGR